MLSSKAAAGWTRVVFAVGGLLAGCGGRLVAANEHDASPSEPDAGCSGLEGSVAGDAEVDPCFVPSAFYPPASPCPNGVSCLVAWSEDGGTSPIYSIDPTAGRLRAPLAVTDAYVLTEVDLEGPAATLQCELLEVPLDGREPAVLESQSCPSGWSFYVTVGDDGFVYYASGAVAESSMGVAPPSQFTLGRVPSGALSTTPTVLATVSLVADLELVVDAGYLYVSGPLGVVRIPAAGGTPEPIVTTPVAVIQGSPPQQMAVAGGSLFYVSSGDAGPAGEARVFRTDADGLAPAVALAAPGLSSDPYLLTAASCPSLFVSGHSVERFALDGTPLGTVVPPIVSAHDPPISFQNMAVLGTHLFVQQVCEYTDPGPMLNVRDVDLTTGQSVLLSSEPGWPFLPGNLLAPHNKAGTRFYFTE